MTRSTFMAQLGYLWHPRWSFRHTFTRICPSFWLVEVVKVIWNLRLAFQVQVLDNVSWEASILTLDGRGQVLIDCKLQLTCRIGGIVNTVCDTIDLFRVVLEVEARISVHQFVMWRAFFSNFARDGDLTEIFLESWEWSTHSDSGILWLELEVVCVDWAGGSLDQGVHNLRGVDGGLFN